MSKLKPTKEEIKNIILNKQKGIKVSNKKVSSSESEDELKKYNINRDSYESSSNAEDLEDYKIDGYHPTQLGEKFSNARYTVIQKLGWGHFSTVWLVHDKRNNQHYAMKIQKSKKSYCESALDELELLRQMNSHSQDNNWVKFVDEFNSAQSQMKWIQENKLQLKTSRFLRIKSSSSSSWVSEDENSNEEIQKQDETNQVVEENNQEVQETKETSKSKIEENDQQNQQTERVYQYEIDETAINEKITLEETFCIKLIDNFCHFGVHGKHYCSLFEIMGPTLLDLIQHFDQYDRNIGIWLVKIITRQILQGLVFLHDVCGMIHTDLKPENIMIQLQTSYLDEFVEDMKKLKKRPTSMKFLAIQSQKNQQKNKKKNKKKKKQAIAKQEQQQEEAKLIEQTNPNLQQQEDKTQENQNTEKVLLVNTQIDQSTLKDQSQTLDIKSQNQEQIVEKKLKAKKQFIAEDDEDSDYEKYNNEKKEKKSIKSDSSDESKSKSKTPVDEETLYQLKWKEHIQIKIDKLIKIKIVDFGNACWINKKFTDNIQTREYRSPEAILGIDYQANTDIWSLACIVFELLTNNYLFKPKKGQGFGKSDDHLALMMETLGKMNKTFALSGSRSREFFNKNGQLMNIKDLRQMSIQDQLVDDYDFSEKDAVSIEDFLLPMLEYDPKKRISAREALKHPWLWTQ